jgi:hypothetical protein
MMDGKSLSKMIRMKKKQQGEADLNPDMDYAGQEAVDPNEAWDDKQAMEVNEAMGEPDHEPASSEEMGEHESSQDKAMLKKTMMRINKYFDSMGI